MRHLYLEMEVLEQRIAPCGITVHSSGSGGSKGGGSKGDDCG